MGEIEQTEAGAARASEMGGKSDFLREVGIIVLGVLIALVVGEMASAVRQRVEARRSMAAIRADMIDNSSTFEIAGWAASCAQRRLDDLSNELALFRQGGTLRSLGEIGQMPVASFRSGSWDSAVANRDVLFLDKADVAELTDYHDVLRTYQALRDESSLDWARLTVLSNAPGPLDDNTYATAKQTIAELRYRTRMIDMMAHVLLESHQRLGFPVVYTPYNGKAVSKAESLRRVKESPLCQPLKHSRAAAETKAGHTPIAKTTGVFKPNLRLPPKADIC